MNNERGIIVYNSRSIEKVLTALYLDNNLIISPEYPLRLEDFYEKKYQAIYTALYNLYTLGNNHIDINDIVAYFKEQQGMYEKFIQDGGMDVLYQVCNDETPLNFDYNYGSVKKHTLLRDFIKLGIDTTDIYDKSLSAEQFEKQMSRFNALSIEDMFKHYEAKINNLQNKYQNLLEKSCINAAEGIEELYLSLQTIPEVGLPLEGEMYNTVTRGARLKKLYIDSGASGTGKSRRMVGNACKLAIPLRYNTETDEWEHTGMENKVLFVTTELEHAEVQTLILAYISGVNEDKILNNKYSGNEQERVELAIQYLLQHSNIILEFLPNPTIPVIKTTIKKHVLQNDVEYVFYDYIHITAGLMDGRDKQTRDDVVLMLVSDTLKNLANELNIHISSATQLNGDYEEKEVKNQNLIRGSKAIADKADIGAITLPMNQAEVELGRALALKLGTLEPNFITDIYKNRRGKWTAIRIWRYIDLGTCRTYDCFVTDRSNDPIDFDSVKVQVKQAAKVGGFVVTPKQDVDPYENFGESVRIEV